MTDRAAEFSLLADRLDAAACARTALSPLTDSCRLDLGDAYAIQSQLVARRVARGERVVGLKMGFTSEAMRRQMGVEQPNCGWLTDAMALEPGEALDLSTLIHPRVEPEVALRLGRDLGWPAEAAQVAAAVDAWAPALEIVDSRFHAYRFRGEDNTADNSSAAAFVVGDWRQWPADLSGLRIRLLLDGLVVEEGGAEAVMGHPLNSLGEAARMAAGLGRPLQAGMIVLTGGVTSAHPIAEVERIEARFGADAGVSLAVNSA